MSNTIADVEVGYYRLPFDVPLSDSTHGIMTAADLVIVRIRDNDGGEGVGYAPTTGVGGGAMADLIRRDMTPTLLGEDADAIEDIWQRLWWRLHYIGRGGLVGFAMAAVDVALWDLRARRVGLPLWRWLGGKNPKVPVYAGGIDLQFTLDQLLAQTEDNINRGFRAIKMKVGREKLSEDVDRVREMRSVLGDDFPLMVDANMGWRVDQAIAAARALQPFNLTWLEEPTIPDDHTGNARIRREGGVPIANGENLHTIYEFRDLIAAGGADFVEPDLSTCGGITPWLKVAAMAEAHNLPITSHGVHDVHVHLLSAITNQSYLEAHGFGLEAYLAEPLNIEDGFATAPDRPGHGMSLDWQALKEIKAE